jgi:hypothetical protein
MTCGFTNSKTYRGNCPNPVRHLIKVVYSGGGESESFLACDYHLKSVEVAYSGHKVLGRCPLERKAK